MVLHGAAAICAIEAWVVKAALLPYPNPCVAPKLLPRNASFASAPPAAELTVHSSQLPPSQVTRRVEPVTVKVPLRWSGALALWKPLPVITVQSRAPQLAAWTPVELRLTRSRWVQCQCDSVTWPVSVNV